jgi:hypothetical protein
MAKAKKLNTIVYQDVESINREIEYINSQIPAIKTFKMALQRINDVCGTSIKTDNYIFLDVEKALTEKAKFPNSRKCAELLDLESEYIFLSEYSFPLYINPENDSIEDYVKEDIVEKHTQRLSDEDEKLFQELLIVCEKINSIETVNPNRYIQIDYDGKAKVNISRLHNKRYL